MVVSKKNTCAIVWVTNYPGHFFMEYHACLKEMMNHGYLDLNTEQEDVENELVTLRF